jgi:hypothetical protein
MKTKPNIIGKRVRLDACTDIHTKLQHGDEGVVMDVDDIGTVHVLWDNGSILGLLTDEGDAFSIVEQETDDQITLEEKRMIRELQKTAQFAFAEGLIGELVALDPDIEIDPFMLLDALGCAGLSLTIGTDASRTWIESLK